MEQQMKRRRVASSPPAIDVPVPQKLLAPLVAASIATARFPVQVSHLLHIVRSVSSFLDNSSKWTLESASDAGY